MATLKLAPNLPLPLDAVTQRLGEIGRPGSGKSYLGTKMAELFYDAGAQFVAFDPVGIWYGLRVDGKGKGLDIPIFGGLHGDVPLEPTAGALLADMIVDRRLSCVLDVSQFESDMDKARFVAGFIKRFYFRKKAAPSAVHLFFEECQEFFPQNPQRGEEQMLHEGTRMAKLGRNFGIGISLLSQRPQEVNKKVLNLTECLFAFQMTGVHERKAIRDWVSAKGADEDILAILPTLAVGVAHVYSPQWLRISEQVKCYEKRSADVSSTPEVDADAAVIETKPLGKSELGKLREQMAATIEKAKQEDPKELRKRIAELERAAKGARVGDVPHAVMASQINAAVAAAVKPYKKALASVEAWRKRLVVHARSVQDGAAAIATLGDALLDAATVSEAERTTEDSRAAVQVGHESWTTGANHPSVSAVGRSSRAPARPIATSPSADGPKIGRTGEKILGALAFYESVGKTPTPASMAAAFVGMSASGGSWGARLSELRQVGLIVTERGTLELTDEGRARADRSGLPSTLEDLHDLWRSKLGGKARAMLDVLLEAYPSAITKEQLAERVEMEQSGGSFGARLSEVRAPGLLDETVARGEVRASDVLFPEGL